MRTHKQNAQRLAVRYCNRLAHGLRTATEFPTENARKKYLKDHPKADPKRHTVKEPDGKSDEKGSKKPKKVKETQRFYNAIGSLSEKDYGNEDASFKAVDGLFNRMTKGKAEELENMIPATLNFLDETHGDTQAKATGIGVAEALLKHHKSGANPDLDDQAGMLQELLDANK